MIRFRHLAGAFCTALMLASGAAWAQGSSNDSPRPPGSDPSTRVERLQGNPPTPPGTPGNPTGRAIDRPANPPAANAVPGRPMPGGMAAPGNPESSGRTGGSAPTN
ncbi:hypothetical protein [Sediminicoccus sp. BL-A-41-H5]|uniref:hypothetical protein n=1 Tax=Sediminicoccus sp. BL-A-41-H5 TaxID=3421106 RepID=UPI003D671AE7